MSNLVIVAIPEEDDYVWKISSEKIPHMTILFLGDPTNTPNVSKMTDFLEHASNTVLEPFWLDVAERGVLGADNADVVFFEGSWDLPLLKDFRAALLKDDSIRKAFDAADQHPDWVPHLTLGYPKTPAHPDNRDYPGIRSVRFNKIALWTGDFSGPEFKLKSEFQKYPMEAAMSGITPSGSGDIVSKILAHHGVKGMRWGVRGGTGSPTATTVKQSGKKLKTSGGKGHPAHEDAVNAASVAQKAKASGIHTLSNKELADLGTRMNLEQNVQRLQAQKNSAGAKGFIKQLLVNVGKNQAQRVANDVATQKVDKLIANKKAKGQKA